MTICADLESMAKQLEESGDYRVLRKIKKPTAQQIDNMNDYNIAAILDIETTGLDHNNDEIIEIGLIKFLFSEDCSQLLFIEELHSFIEPKIKIPHSVTEITNIDDSMVKGTSLDEHELATFVNDVNLIIAHNAAFDRQFCEKKWDIFSSKAWACSINDVPWKNEGIQNVNLASILNEFGLYHDGHRALEDCYAVLEILSKNLPRSKEIAMKSLIHNARKATIRIWAVDSPYEYKDILKKRGYKWSDGIKDSYRSWWIDVPEELCEDELKFLRHEIYTKKVEIPTQRFTAFDRYSII